MGSDANGPLEAHSNKKSVSMGIRIEPYELPQLILNRISIGLVTGTFQ